MTSNFEPYYAVIFTSKRTEGDNGYAEMSQLMDSLVKKQKGFIGVDSARNDIGITVSYWKNLEAIKNWKQQIFFLELKKKVGHSFDVKNYDLSIYEVFRTI